MNKKINISNRLKTIGDFTIDNTKIVDVGCDHGLLSIYIYQNKKNVKILATDININPLNEARKNIKNYGLEEKIQTRISNGLQNVNKDEIDTIIISGLGGNTIVEILNNDLDKVISSKRIIIQANNNIDKVRKFLVENKFLIKDEKLVSENNIISTIIIFDRSSKKLKYSIDEILFGPVLLKEKSDLFKELMKRKIKKQIYILNKIPKKYILKRIKIKRFINKIKSHIS